jgi:PKD repeat protein
MKYFLVSFVCVFIICCSKKNDVTQAENPLDFSYELLENGKVKFTNLSKGIDSLSWDFGDFYFKETTVGTISNMVHTYLANGRYTVKLAGKKADKTWQKEVIVNIGNRKEVVDNVIPICNQNQAFGLRTNIGMFCSDLSEYRAVIMRKHKLGRQFDFWYLFRNTFKIPVDAQEYEFSLVFSAIINDVGEWEFKPVETADRTYEANSAWIEVGYDRSKTLPLNNFVVPQHVRLNISKLTEELISGAILITFDEQRKWYGNFKDITIRKSEN